MRDDEDGEAGFQAEQSVADGGFIFGVECAGWFIENEQSGATRRARASAMRWRSPPESWAPRSPTRVVQMFGQFPDKSFRRSFPKRFPELFLGCIRIDPAQVVPDGIAEQEMVLGKVGGGPSPTALVGCINGNSVDQKASTLGVVQAQNEIGEG